MIKTVSRMNKKAPWIPIICLDRSVLNWYIWWWYCLNCNFFNARVYLGIYLKAKDRSGSYLSIETLYKTWWNQEYLMSLTLREFHSIDKYSVHLPLTASWGARLSLLRELLIDVANQHFRLIRRHNRQGSQRPVMTNSSLGRRMGISLTTLAYCVLESFACI